MKYTAPITSRTVNDVLIFSQESISERNHTYEIEEYHHGYMAIGQNGGGLLYLIDLTGCVYTVGCGDPSPPRYVAANVHDWLSQGCPDDETSEGEQHDDDISQDLWALPGITLRHLSLIKRVLGLNIRAIELKQMANEAPCLIASNIPKPRTQKIFENNQLDCSVIAFRTHNEREGNRAECCTEYNVTTPNIP